MGAMARRRAHVAAIGLLALTACGSSDPEPLPQACLAEPAAIVRALEQAPAPVTLADATRLSRCVSLAREGELESLGVSLTQVADDLRSRAGEDPAEALRLGYLVGAVRRGAALTPGLAAQLARRVEQSANPEIEARRPRAELARGIGLGEAGG